MTELVLTEAELPDDFLSAQVLGSAYYQVVQTREVPGFRFGCLIATRGGVRVAVVPYFVTRFKFNTMLEEGVLNRWMGD